MRTGRLQAAGLACLLAAGVLALPAARPGPEASSGEKVLAPGALRLAGRTMRCGRTPTLLSHTFWDYGGARKGMIILNPSKMEKLSGTVRLYVYAHECGHQIYGPRELRADCYAVERGKRDGWLDASGMNEICAFLADKPADWVHPPGPKRCEIMRACYAKARPARAQR